MNLTRLKLDGVRIKLPRGSVTKFTEGQEEMAKGFFEDYSQYGRDCVHCGMFLGIALSAGCVAVLYIRNIRKKAKEEKSNKSEEAAE